MKTFHSITAGSTFITPKGVVRTFAGKFGGTGTYVASDPAEIEMLEGMVASPAAQIYAEGEKAETKIDPTVALAAADAYANTALETDAKISALRDNLGAVIASAKKA